MTRQRSPRNRTVTLSADEQATYRQSLLHLGGSTQPCDLLDRVLHGDLFDVLSHLPTGFVDLMVIDPPYNLTKRYNGTTFQQRDDDAYLDWVRRWFEGLVRLLKPTATVYVCAEWRTSPMIYTALREHFTIRNRITWEREKGRGSDSNWKNNSEDIWFATVGSDYTFNVDEVKLKRRVLAPYRGANGAPKDWQDGSDGRFRLTYPSNLWTDLSVPFWSMPENTDHPTQKPEKLVAKLLLASSNPGDVVFDPFLGSGTTAVVAKKLTRRFVGVEIDEMYACLALKRLALADEVQSIQGYRDGVFWERNSKK
jgi:site-specific DNA-methyltransferase (adenine-specific)